MMKHPFDKMAVEAAGIALKGMDLRDRLFTEITTPVLQAA